MMFCIQSIIWQHFHVSLCNTWCYKYPHNDVYNWHHHTINTKSSGSYQTESNFSFSFFAWIHANTQNRILMSRIHNTCISVSISKTDRKSWMSSRVSNPQHHVRDHTLTPQLSDRIKRDVMRRWGFRHTCCADSFTASYLPSSGLLVPLPALAVPWIPDAAAAPRLIARSAQAGLLHYTTRPLAFESALLPEAPHCTAYSQLHPSILCMPSLLILLLLLLLSIPFNSKELSCNQHKHRPVTQ